MSRERPLRGACSCGRNQYLIVVPQDSTASARVLFDDSSEHRRHQASPLTAWLRVPLSWYHSTTYSLYPDETHAAIRRAFTPTHAPHTKRYFCGFCGTPLTYWSEQPREESEFLSVTLGSLLGEDLRELEELGLLQEDSLNGDGQRTASGSVVKRSEGSESVGLPWFQELVEGSQLGRIGTSRRGGGVSADGRTRVEWEILEFGDGVHGSDGGIGTAKRKIGEVVEGEGNDVEMGSGS
ncbi:MAG: hypothetical protein M1830_003779 [Pleopsidium flavum]|nr:MAG: hypothetical protein M1830_003779 [Pleopsidium flavum]